MPTRIIERGTAGPAYSAATCPVITKMPAPMTAPMPSVMRLSGPSARVRACSPRASAWARSAAIGLVANRGIRKMWGPPRTLPTGPGRPGLRAGRAGLGRGRGEQVTAVATAERHARAAFENDDPVAVEPGLHLAHPVEVDERGPADAPEPLRIHSRLERGERGPHGMHAVAGVQPHIVARRFDPVHVRRPHEEAAPVVHDEQALGVAPRCRLLRAGDDRLVEGPQPGFELRRVEAALLEITVVVRCMDHRQNRPVDQD